MAASAPAARQSGGELLVGALEELGVSLVFGLPGVHNLPAWKALAGSPLRLVSVRHEQAAAYAADGYARSSGRLGVALTTTGPGAANTLAATGEAWASGSPLLVIATDIPTSLRRPGSYRGVLHETTDQAGMFAPVTKGLLRVTRTEDIPAAVRAAATLALAAPARPVYLEVPTDLLAGSGGTGPDVDPAPVEPSRPGGSAADAGQPAVAGSAAHAGKPALAGSAAHVGELALAGSAAVAGAGAPEPTSLASPAPGGPPPPDEAQVAAAAALLARAERPLIWTGGGAVRAGASAAVARLAERLVAPVLQTYGAAGLLPPGHPCAVGLPPHMPEAGRLWDESDLVVAIGSDFDGMTTQNWAMPPPPALVAVNVDEFDAAKNYTPDVVVVADAALGTDALAERVPARPGIDALAERLAEGRAAARRALDADEPGGPGLIDAMVAALPGDAVVVADMCIPGYWLAGFYPSPAPRRLLYPVGWGTLGFAFPAGLGAALAGTGPVVSVSGDGGFLFACGELATMAQEAIPLTAVVVDDGGYGMLRYDQQRGGDPIFGVDLQSPDFVALASSFGVDAQEVAGLGADFGAALHRHMRSDRPSVLVARAALKPPPTTSPRWYRRA